MQGNRKQVESRGRDPRILFTWPRGVTASTLDSESSDRGSNPREALGILCPGLGAWSMIGRVGRSVWNDIGDSKHQASLAQLAEHALRKRMVMGSIPIGGLF